MTVPDAPTEPDAVLRWAASRPREEGRYELSRGIVFGYMINVTRRHAEVCSNVFIALSRKIDADRYLITMADYGVRTLHGIRGPDVMVELRPGEPGSLATDKPILLVKVLSPSTAGIDFTEKRDEYLAITSLQTYIIVSADDTRVWAWRRAQDGSWPAHATLFESRGDAVTIAGLGVDLELAHINRGIP